MQKDIQKQVKKVIRGGDNILTEGNCLVFRRYEDLRNMMEDMNKYQGARISIGWFVTCERIINEQGIIYIKVLRDSFMYFKNKPCKVERYIEIISRRNNKRW